MAVAAMGAAMAVEEMLAAVMVAAKEEAATAMVEVASVRMEVERAVVRRWRSEIIGVSEERACSERARGWTVADCPTKPTQTQDEKFESAYLHTPP